MRFSWDVGKSRLNEAKHGVDFETATLVFDDPFHISLMDRVEHGEERWQTVGMANDVMMLLVAHTLWDENGDEVVRVISARKATPGERKRYEEGHA
jgi:hypothetical protein